MGIEKTGPAAGLQQESDDLAVPGFLDRSLDPPKTNGSAPPITVGDPDDIDEFAIDQSHLEELAVPGTDSTVVECRRPPKGIFFTVRPERPGEPWKDRNYFWILEIEGRDPYLVSPGVARQKNEEEDVLRPVLLVRYVTMTGEEGLWPVKLNPPDKRANAWNTSALAILELAEGRWVRIVSLKKHYRHQLSGKTIEEVPPKFSTRSFRELRAIAFNDRIVPTLDHEIWNDLKHGSSK
jgi:hypothetical protein